MQTGTQPETNLTPREVERLVQLVEEAGEMDGPRFEIDGKIVQLKDGSSVSIGDSVRAGDAQIVVEKFYGNPTRDRVETFAISKNGDVILAIARKWGSKPQGGGAPDFTGLVEDTPPEPKEGVSLLRRLRSENRVRG